MIVSLGLSTGAFVLGSKIIAKEQSPPPISIAYPEGYIDLPEEKIVKSSKASTKTKKVRKPRQTSKTLKNVVL
ncbi:MAG: hypothetical protein WCG97_00415 [bacterium]